MSAVFKIVPTTQQYDWGKRGSKSKVAQLASASQIPNFFLDESKPYAELWMGTHPTSPSHLLDSASGSASTKLSEYLKSNPSLIGSRVAELFPDAKEGNLPFLFKVLSIEKALSIQTHPDKATAEKLHAEQPNIYKDPNHKPELALALTPFRALCGFQPLTRVANNLNSTPELAALVTPTIVEAFVAISQTGCTPDSPAAKIALRDLFSAVMTAPKELVKEQVENLVARYRESGSGADKDNVEMVLTLSEQFPGDIGIFCVFLLNHVTLNPGEAIFLGAGEPHAYVAGDIIECMANSDNVIRAGLTPKLIDIPNLIAGLTYVPGEPERHQVKPVPFPPSSSSSTSALFDPPIPEFSVVQVKLAVSATESHPPVGGPSLIVVIDGQGSVEWNGTTSIKSGDVLFVGAETAIKFTCTEGELVLYRAFVEAKE
ncbi:mannose-6-phosphate isomerase [Moniliophthora roreri MCA 2997]|uniref:Mannose-6-phosphate isomerase n=1 Tax=Moniliophthora roreri (strain MCA 2997) TaxID=1381753 RepID=V2X688_MONRO|nr:mannose-6-phosphate isomerase [Moniliophthora roreri MCA 2997]KAI3613227.1 mannose-6-phosphate isomerase [Moniliophthora roreri]